MAYDSTRGVTVLFGGYDEVVNNAETWEWDGDQWSLRATSGPLARAYHSMVYDSGRGVSVLFGGSTVFFLGSPLGDTWEWDGASWTQRQLTGPSARTQTAMAYDSARGVIVLFGGWDGTDRADTWEYNGSQWSLRSTVGPSPRHAHALVYDSTRGVCVLFGGDAGGHNDETWEWNGVAWTQRPGPSPGRTYLHQMVYDPDWGRTVLFGGESPGIGARNQTWSWDGASWSQLPFAGPSARWEPGLAYDSGRNVTVLFGGETNLPFGDTWELGPPCQQPVVAVHPFGRSVCPSAQTRFTVAATNPGVSYQWQVLGGPASAWTDLVEGANVIGGQPVLTATGATSESLVADGGLAGWIAGLQFRCVLRTACGEAISNAAPLGTVPDMTATANPFLPGFGVPDGIVNNEDFFFYLALFAAGDPRADVTTGAIPGLAGFGTPNGMLDSNDFFHYLALFASGC
ncbi:MAG: hypothetical protein KDA05_05535 [Phycisphaerales bacterium]|nr:hypothetical protein [Phycisphaerales bacterium]